MQREKISFKVTPSQEKSIAFRVSENGFDDMSAYLKVMALKTQPFSMMPLERSAEEATQELSFEVTEAQKKTIELNMKEIECEDMQRYLLYVALHGVVSAIVEVRSTGNLDDMLKRIQDAKRSAKLGKTI